MEGLRKIPLKQSFFESWSSQSFVLAFSFYNTSHGHIYRIRLMPKKKTAETQSKMYACQDGCNARESSCIFYRFYQCISF